MNWQSWRLENLNVPIIIIIDYVQSDQKYEKLRSQNNKATPQT